MYLRELKRVKDSLLVNDMTISQEIFKESLVNGFDVNTTIAVVYLHGFLDGRNSMKQKKAESYRRLDIAHKLLVANNIPIPDYRIPLNDMEGTDNE